MDNDNDKDIKYFSDKQGWIKLHRKLQDNALYKSLNSKHRDVMLQLLLMANHAPAKWIWRGEEFECKPGQFITSLQSIKANCAKDVSVKSIRSALNKLKRYQFLADKGAKTGRLVTIINWSKYQVDEEKGANNGANNGAVEGQRGGKEGATNKNNNNEKKLEKENSEKIYLSIDFYERELKKNHNTTEAYLQYRYFVQHLKGNNKKRKQYDKSLSLTGQVNFECFKDLRGLAEKHNAKIIEKLDAFEVSTLPVKYDCLFTTLYNWIKDGKKGDKQTL